MTKLHPMGYPALAAVLVFEPAVSEHDVGAAVSVQIADAVWGKTSMQIDVLLQHVEGYGGFLPLVAWVRRNFVPVEAFEITGGNDVDLAISIDVGRYNVVHFGLDFWVIGVLSEGLLTRVLRI